MRRLAALLAVAALTGACEPVRAPVEVELSWRFADGRPCDLAGVQDVVVEGAAAGGARLRCADGLAPNGSLPLSVDMGDELLLEALSVTGAVLYRGRATPDRDGGYPVVILRFVGGR